MKEYKTIFVDAPKAKSKGIFSMKLHTVNGDDFSRNIQATIIEYSNQGFTLKSKSMINSAEANSSGIAYTYTSGAVLVFEKDIE